MTKLLDASDVCLLRYFAVAAEENNLHRAAQEVAAFSLASLQQSARPDP